MRNEQIEPGRASETGNRAEEARLLEEILNRMDVQSKAASQQNNPYQKNAAKAEDTIDLAELFFFLLSKLHFVVLGMVLGGILMGMTAIKQVPIYTATSKLYIMGQTGLSIITDLQIGTVLTSDYLEVFKTWEVHEMVNEQLGLDYTYSQLQNMLTVTNAEDTRILYITVRNTDPQRAADIANAYAVAAKQFITEVMDSSEPSTFSVALVPTVAQKASVTNSIIKGILFGTVAVCGILGCIFLLDNRPKSPEDILRCANIPTLAVIPANPELFDSRKYNRKKVGKQ